MAPIHDAVSKFDVGALRSELDRGVCPNLEDDDDDSDSEDGICTPLHSVLQWSTQWPERKLEERVACVAALLEAGAAVNAMSVSGTPLHAAVQYEEFGDIVDLLLVAGADVNAVDDLFEESVIVTAAQYNDNATIVKKLISAGARDLDDALVHAVSNGKLRNCAPLLRAGAALPPVEPADEMLKTIKEHKEYYSCNWELRRALSIASARNYIAKISGTPGGFRGYEREHRRRLTVVFANKFPALPIDVISHIVLLWAHCGDYDYEGYDPAALCGNDDEDSVSSSASGSDSDSESDDAEE